MESSLSLPPSPRPVMVSIEGARSSVHPEDALPNEILADIFSLCAPSKISDRRMFVKNIRGRLQEWINFTHVCSRWRAVALQTPSIWCSPDFSIPGLALEMVHRSKKMPLTIRLRAQIHCRSVDSRAKGLLFDAIPNFLSRALDLEIDLSHHSCCDKWIMDLVSDVARPYPHLTYLTMSPKFNSLRTSSHGLSKISLEGHPRLKELRLYGCDIANLGSTKDLEVLSVVSRPWITPLLASAHLLDRLRVQSNLRVLELVNCFSPGPPREWSQRTPLSLTQLRQIEISASFLDLASVLPFITFPPTTTVSISSSDFLGVELPVFITFIAQCFKGTQREVKSVHIADRIHNDSHRIIVQTWPTTDIDDFESHFSISMNLDLLPTQDGFASHINEILSVIPLAKVRRLGYNFPFPSSLDSLVHFQSLPSVYTIACLGQPQWNTFQRMLDILAPNQGSESVVTADQLNFPALGRFILDDASFLNTGSAPEAWLIPFGEVLKARSELGVPLPPVILKGNVIRIDRPRSWRGW
ncbi:hypothetical protein PQX77_019238 [Marasmius sp. AFHP31]|nr:hypothetical protein PQX77_019238 [Marasmius sp. AFHP31]